MDESAQIHQRKDANGTPCAMVRVLFKEPGAKFEGSYVVGDPENFTGGYNVYLASGGKKFTMKHDKYLPQDVNISNYGIKAAQTGKTYEMSVVTRSTELTSDVDINQLKTEAENGNVKAQYQLAKNYANGIDVE